MNSEKFEIKINEYNVAYNINDREEFDLVINDNNIKINNKEIKEDIERKINNVKNVILENLDKLKLISNAKQQAYKGGRQKRMDIEMNGKTYIILGNNPNVEIAQLYSNIINEIQKIIKE